MGPPNSVEQAKCKMTNRPCFTLPQGWNWQGVRLQYLAAVTTLETCLEHPFTQPIADKRLHLKQQKERNSSSTIASYCVAWTIVRTIATANNYCSCGIHPFSELPKTLCNIQDAFDHDKGQKSAISGRRLHWRLSTGFFVFSPVFMCN